MESNDDKLIPLFTHKVKLPKVKYRKLGKEKSWGQYHSTNNLIEIDERLKGKKLLEMTTHESIHAFRKDFTENEVRLLSRQLCELLWKEGWRKVDNNEK